MTNHQLTLWQRIRQWLFYRLFWKEAQTLDRYRLHVGQLEEWFIGHVPEVHKAAQWARRHSEPLPGLKDLHELPDGRAITGLREQLVESRRRFLGMQNVDFTPPPPVRRVMKTR